MIQCWSEDPNNRPTFNRLREITTEFIQEEVGQSLINVTVITACAPNLMVGSCIIYLFIYLICVYI